MKWMVYIGPIANFGPYPWDGKTLQYKRPSRNILNHYPCLVKKHVYQNCQREVRVGSIAILDLKGIDGKNGGVFKYNNTSDRSLMPDEIISDWGCKLLKGISTFSYNKDLKRYQQSQWTIDHFSCLGLLNHLHYILLMSFLMQF